MKVFRTDNGNDGKGKVTFGLSSVILGLYLVGLVLYSLWISDENCLRYIGRRGISEDCSAEKTNGMISLGFISAWAFVFLFLGIYNTIRITRIKNKRKLNS